MITPDFPAHIAPPVFSQILDDEELAPRHLKVWRAALPLLDFVTPRPLTLDVLEHATGIDRANLSRLVNRLLERGYLLRDGREGRLPLYRVPLARCTAYHGAAAAAHVDDDGIPAGLPDASAGPLAGPTRVRRMRSRGF